MPDDPLKTLLDSAKLPKPVKAQLWDAYDQSKDAADLQTRLDKLSVPTAVKAGLWDLKAKQSAPTMNTAVVNGQRVPVETAVADDFIKAEQERNQPQGSAIGRLASNFGEMVNPVTLVKGVAGAVAHPIDTVTSIANAQIDQGKQAWELAKQGRLVEAAGHGGAAVLPLLGPAAAQAGEQIASGDVAGGIGKGAGLLVPVLAPSAVRAVRGAAPRAASVPDALNASARKGVSRFINATTRPLKAEARRVEQGVLDRGIVGTQQGVLDRAAAQQGVAGRAIQRAESATATANPGNVVPTQSVMDAIDRVSRGTLTTDAAGKPIVRIGKESLNAATQYFKDYVAGQGNTITVEKAAALKRDFQEVANAAKQYMADDPAKAKGFVAKKAGAAIRKELLKVNPDLEAVWAEYGFWTGLKDVLQWTTERTRPQQGWGKKAIDLAAAASGAAPGVASGSSLEAAVGSAAMATLAHVVQSPTWKLVSAQAKNQIAQALASGNAAKLTHFLNRIGPAAVQTGRLTSPSGLQMQPATASGPPR